jgi:formylglycine-generating enzyme required for sulfatase activity
MSLRLSVFLVGVSTLLHGDPGGNWPGFRGTGDSTAPGAKLPLHWSDRHNLAWKVPLPGFGQSTPVVGGGRIYLTAIEGKKKETLHVLALEERTGRTLWQKSFASSRPQEAGDRVARAASTPALDGDMLYAMFDSGDLLALTTGGELRWRLNCNTKFTPIQNGHDFGSSIRQTKDALHVFVNHVGPSYLVSLAKVDGTLRWKVDFPAEGGWNTPVVTTHKGKEILLLQRSGGVAAYAVKDGELLWEDLKTFSRESAIPSLTVAGDVVVVPSQGKGGTWAFRLDQPKQPLWTAKTATNAFSSPLVTRERAYFVNSVGALFAVDLATGKDLWTTRLPATTWASAIAVGDRAYFFTGDGDTFVFRDAPAMEKLAESHLDADSLVYAATPLDDGLLLRSGTQLWKVADLGQTDPNPPAVRAPVRSKQEEPPLPPVAPGKPGERRRNVADGLELAWIAGGEFQMGCSPGDTECERDESPGHAVKLTRGFWMNTTEVTVGAFRKFAAARGITVEPGDGDTLPATRVNHATAAGYCRWAGGRLPTEAEWEYAARAGTTGARYGAVNDVAWLADNSGKAPLDAAKLAREQRGAYMPTLKENGNGRRPVAGKKANAFGLFDMLGNVAEWTADWHDLYTAAPATDPKGPADGEKRVARGGSWGFYPAAIRVSTRLKLGADAASDSTGFRCAQ